LRLRIHRFLPETKVEGPGTRACIWVQGCPIRCVGCFAPDTWAMEGGTEYDIADLAQPIFANQELEGVTFLGGEPFAQAEALAGLARLLRERYLSVITFTGYYLEDILAAGRLDWSELLSVTDLLIDGPFQRELEDYSRPWAGSSNQGFHFLTSRYESLKNNLSQYRNQLEIRLREDGTVSINGMAVKKELDELIHQICLTKSTQGRVRLVD
jgi:anaerobic ribonucleoside-triphosphate reductase activating protein